MANGFTHYHVYAPIKPYRDQAGNDRGLTAEKWAQKNDIFMIRLPYRDEQGREQYIEAPDLRKVGMGSEPRLIEDIPETKFPGQGVQHFDLVLSENVEYPVYTYNELAKGTPSEYKSERMISGKDIKQMYVEQAAIERGISSVPILRDRLNPAEYDDYIGLLRANIWASTHLALDDAARKTEFVPVDRINVGTRGAVVEDEKGKCKFKYVYEKELNGVHYVVPITAYTSPTEQPTVPYLIQLNAPDQPYDGQKHMAFDPKSSFIEHWNEHGEKVMTQARTAEMLKAFDGAIPDDAEKEPIDDPSYDK